MSGRCYETWLALYVEGDLPERRVGVVERHLSQCASCRTFLQELQHSQEAMRGLRQETVDAHSLARIRQGVLTEAATTARASRPVTARLAIAGIAVTLLVIGAVAWHRAPANPSEPVSSQSAAAHAVYSPEDAIWDPQPVQAPVPDTAVNTRDHYPTAEPLKIKLVTDDPSVVIYWLADSTEEYRDDSTA